MLNWSTFELSGLNVSDYLVYLGHFLGQESHDLPSLIIQNVAESRSMISRFNIIWIIKKKRFINGTLSFDRKYQSQLKNSTTQSHSGPPPSDLVLLDTRKRSNNIWYHGNLFCTKSVKIMVAKYYVTFLWNKNRTLWYSIPSDFFHKNVHNNMTKIAQICEKRKQYHQKSGIMTKCVFCKLLYKMRRHIIVVIDLKSWNGIWFSILVVLDLPKSILDWIFYAICALSTLNNIS